MPALEFNGMFRSITQEHVFQPSEMHWSTFEFNKEQNIQEMDQKQNERLLEYINGHYEAHAKFEEAVLKVEEEYEK